MKRIAWLVIAAFAVAGVTVASTRAQDPDPAWSFVAEASDSGWVMTCTTGCAWERLSFGCGDASQSCRVKIDQFGVGPVIGR